MTTNGKVATCLWFEAGAEEAAAFYVSVLPDARITDTLRMRGNGPGPDGAVLTVAIELAGQRFVFLNGGPMFRLSEAASIMVECDTQDEIDRLWTALTADGGEESRCGWLKDRFGVSWQIVPRAQLAMLADPDRAKAGRAFEAMLGMRKLDLPALQRAFDGH